MRNWILLLAIVSYCSCYRAEKLPVSSASPTYRVLMLQSSIQDSLVTIEVNDTDSVLLTFSFQLASGSAANYPLTFYFSDLPGATSASKDSVNFGLSYNLNTTLYVKADTGYHLFSVNLFNPKDSVHTYQLRLHVLPAKPPVDCSSCILLNWWEFNCAGDSCRPVIAAIPGSPRWVSIRNFGCLGDSITVNAMISCHAPGVVIPVQTVGGYTIYGRFPDEMPCGTYVAFTIPDTIIHNGDTQACSFFLRNF